MAFVHAVLSHSTSPSSLPKRLPVCAKVPSRRMFIRVSTLAAISSLLSRRTVAKEWANSDICTHCGGRGRQQCDMCEGIGTLTFDDGILQENTHNCPNCMGKGSVICLACIGLGLADTSGVLRKGARDGTLRMLRNGTYEILDCSAFPSCDIYGVGRRDKA